MPVGERFLFDVSFDEEELALAEAEVAAKLAEQEAELADPEEYVPTFTEDQLNAARHDGYEAGREAGGQEAGDAIENKLNDALIMIGTQLDELFKRQAVDTATTFTDAVNIAVAIARKCFPHLNDTHGFPEIERMVREVLTEVLEEPRVIIHIDPTLKHALDARIKTITNASNFQGQVIILEAEDMASGDCRISWSSGTAERDIEGTLGKIEQIVKANLGSVREEIAEEVAEEINKPKVDIQPTPASVTDNSAGEPARAIDADISTFDAGGSRENAPTPAPTLVDDIDALVAEIASEAEQQLTDSPVPAPEQAKAEVEAATTKPASALQISDATIKESPESAPPMPLASLLGEALEPQNTADFEGDVNAGEPTGEYIADTPLRTSDKEPPANTEARLQAGPQNVEPVTNGVILNTPSASADAED